jgi:hypothetical protein
LGGAITDIRNAQQVNEIYQKLGAQGLDQNPYILKYEKEGQLLIFVGARHSNDLADTQWVELEKLWKSFVSHRNKKKVVLYEQGPLDVSALSKKEALKQNSESGLVTWLAAKAGIPTEWPEPDRVKEVKYLHNSGYSDTEIMVYYFSRQMLQWITRDKINEPDWRAYANKTVADYDSLSCWDEHLTLELVLGWYEQTTGKDFKPDDDEAIYKLSDPSQCTVSAASGELRDETLLEAITSWWNSGNDIFVIYGSGHSIALEPAIELLVIG